MNDGRKQNLDLPSLPLSHFASRSERNIKSRHFHIFFSFLISSGRFHLELDKASYHSSECQCGRFASGIVFAHSISGRMRRTEESRRDHKTSKLELHLHADRTIALRKREESIKQQGSRLANIFRSRGAESRKLSNLLWHSYCVIRSSDLLSFNISSSSFSRNNPNTSVAWTSEKRAFWHWKREFNVLRDERKRAEFKVRKKAQLRLSARSASVCWKDKRTERRCEVNELSSLLISRDRLESSKQYDRFKCVGVESWARWTRNVVLFRYEEMNLDGNVVLREEIIKPAKRFVEMK